VKQSTMIVVGLAALAALVVLSASKPAVSASLDDRVAWALKNETSDAALSALSQEAALAGRNDLVLALSQRRIDLGYLANLAKKA
jgi:hypothetical protein